MLLPLLDPAPPDPPDFAEPAELPAPEPAPVAFVPELPQPYRLSVVTPSATAVITCRRRLRRTLPRLLTALICFSPVDGVMPCSVRTSPARHALTSARSTGRRRARPSAPRWRGRESRCPRGTPG